MFCYQHFSTTCLSQIRKFIYAPVLWSDQAVTRYRYRYLFKPNYSIYYVLFRCCTEYDWRLQPLFMTVKYLFKLNNIVGSGGGERLTRQLTRYHLFEF
jgi:hypothetical protein